MSIKVIIAGFKGKMGQAAYNMVTEDPALELVGLLDPLTPEKVAGVPVFNQKEDLSGVEADVWVDFTTPKVAYENTRFALEQGFAPVVGTTGFTSDEIKELVEFSRQKELGGLIAPNFAVGAVLLMQFAAQAAKYFPDVEIIELHHDQKKDAPSGTAIKTAELISKVRHKKHQGAMDEKSYYKERVVQKWTACAFIRFVYQAWWLIKKSSLAVKVKDCHFVMIRTTVSLS